LQQQPSFAIIDKGINGDDQSCILVTKGNLYGMGYIPADMQISNIDALKDQLTVYKENSFIRNLVNGYAARFPEKLVRFDEETVYSSH
jgi:DNA polymerase-3 subunit epsilon